MKNDISTPQDCKDGNKWKNKGGATSAVYGIGLIGALVYFIQHAHSFPDGLLGILKALVWPALIVYQLLGFLKI